jgi:FlaA1/EpsC-like NDP-sugar epimerase
MIEVNVLNIFYHLKLFNKRKIKKYFCVSSDKATNPVNFMGASKRIMEVLLTSKKKTFRVSLARFANVLFSDGSLLDGFNKRINKNQPITAPYDVRRYFITPQEAGELCLLSVIFGEDNEVYFPNDKENLKLTKFSEIAKKYLNLRGYIPKVLKTENEARKFSHKNKKTWPCFFFKSDTTGEKEEEEFYENICDVNFKKYKNIGIVNLKKNKIKHLKNFEKKLIMLVKNCQSKSKYKKLFDSLLGNFNHIEKNKSLDEKM